MDGGYHALLEQARTSHDTGRATNQITTDQTDLARLYSYAYRAHTIGAFHATRLAIDTIEPTNALCGAHLQRAAEQLEDLANQGMEPVPDDFRVVLSTFFRYDRGVRRVIDAIEKAFNATGNTEVEAIGRRFANAMAAIWSSPGICPTRDTDAPPQASFIVPNLGITIVPLVYGDHHSWNLAYLNPQNLDVPFHRHQFGVEVHLGYRPLGGLMVLGNCRAPVTESYALPIPPMTRHGWVNTSDRVHHVPFIFGSLVHAGWGVFLDVEPQPMPVDQLRQVSRDDWRMNHAVRLEHEIEATAKMRGSRRRTLLAASVTGRGDSGGLELALSRANESGLTYDPDDFRIVSVVRGSGHVQVGPARCQINHRDHFGIPAGMSCVAQQRAGEPLVLLDALIRPTG